MTRNDRPSQLPRCQDVERIALPAPRKPTASAASPPIRPTANRSAATRSRAAHTARLLIRQARQLGGPAGRSPPGPSGPEAPRPAGACRAGGTRGLPLPPAVHRARARPPLHIRVGEPPPPATTASLPLCPRDWSLPASSSPARRCRPWAPALQAEATQGTGGRGERARGSAGRERGAARAGGWAGMGGRAGKRTSRGRVRSDVHEENPISLRGRSGGDRG